MKDFHKIYQVLLKNTSGIDIYIPDCSKYQNWIHQTFDHLQFLAIFLIQNFLHFKFVLSGVFKILHAFRLRLFYKVKLTLSNESALYGGS